METKSKLNLEKEEVIFVFEDENANESDIYFEISSEEFKKENSFLLDEVEGGNSIELYFWEENDEYDI